MAMTPYAYLKDVLTLLPTHKNDRPPSHHIAGNLPSRNC